MRHPILPQAQSSGATAGEGTQAVVAVGKAEAGRGDGEKRRRSQQMAADERHLLRALQKPAAEREVGALQCLEQARDIADAVLSVRIKGHQELRALGERIGDAGFQRSTLTKIDRMADDCGSRGRSNARRVIAGPVVYDNDLVLRVPQLLQDARQGGGFVKRWADHPD
jgi:hypothetical protein